MDVHVGQRFKVKNRGWVQVLSVSDKSIDFTNFGTVRREELEMWVEYEIFIPYEEVEYESQG